MAGAYVLRAEDVQVGGYLDKKQAQIDEEIAFTIRIVGAHGNLQAPRLPDFKGFDSFYTGRTSQFTFVNGKSTSTVEFSYVLVPKVAGRFTLEPVQVWIEGKSYGTQPLEVEVAGSQIQPSGANPPPASSFQPPAPAPSGQPASSPAPQVINDENIFVKALVDKQTAYPNEQILLTYTLYTRYDTRYEGFEEEPSVSGFWIEDFPLDRDLGRDTVTINGKRYVKADVRKIALFPTAPADYTIQPGTLKVSIREEPKTSNMFDEFFGDSFFSGAGFFARRMDRLLKPPPIVIKVRPFPEAGKPASFNGAVGQFRFSASVDKTTVKQNEPVTLKLVIEGQGNIETLPRPPVPELTSFKIYDGDTANQLLKTGDNLGGKKSFEILFIPTEAGEFSIPPLEFTFFNPKQQAYQNLRSPEFRLKVTPSDEPFRLPAGLEEKEAYKKDIQLESKGIQYIHEGMPSKGFSQMGDFLFVVLTGLNLLGFFVVANGLLRNRREAVFARDYGLKRKKFAAPIASRRLKELKRSLKTKKEDDAGVFLEDAEKVLNEYFSNKFNVSSYSLTTEWLEGKLSELWGADDPLLKQLQEFYERVREIRFGRGGVPTQERRHFLQLIETVIRRLEKMS